MPRTVVNDIKLYWELSGQSGDPLVLVHGSWIDHHSWENIVPELVRRFRVLSYDRRGHGRSQRPGGQGSVREDVADLAALMEELDLAPAHVLGNSFGGTIALKLATERPELFRSLLVHEPPLFALLKEDTDAQGVLKSLQERIDRVADLLRSEQMEAGAREFIETVAFEPGAWERLPRPVQETMTFNAPTFLDELADPESYTIDLRSLVGFEQPMLVTHGDKSQSFFSSVVQRITQALPRARKLTLRGAGHAPEITHPKEYSETITAFVRAK